MTTVVCGAFGWVWLVRPWSATPDSREDLAKLLRRRPPSRPSHKTNDEITCSKRSPVRAASCNGVHLGLYGRLHMTPLPSVPAPLKVNV